MAILSLDSVSKTLAEQALFSGTSFSVEEGEKIGFVGPNGCGKSTLLRILAARLFPDEGSIARQKSLRVNMLDQSPLWEKGDTIRDFLFRSEDPLVRLVDRYERLLEDPEARADDIAKMAHDMEEQGAYTIEHRFSSLLSELHIHDVKLPMDSLSGGMAKKAALARCLAPDSDLVLLDEPTNHLDIETIEWLEKNILQSSSAFIVVTHDRWFLDTVCNVIIDIDRHKASKYQGNYSEYLERLKERAALDDSRERRRESILRVELEWLKRGPKARGGKDKKRKDRIRDLVDGRPAAEAAGTSTFASAKSRLGRKVIELHGISKSWDTNLVLKDFTQSISNGDRIGIVGPNGSGKSTLLDLIAGKYKADSGTLIYGETVKIAYFDQNSSNMDPALSMLEYVQKAADRIFLGDGSELSAEQFLERFGFPRPMQSQLLGKLSGGERRRIHLVQLLISAPNVLLLDEPTNDIDIPTIALLEDFLKDFSGCVLCVSHDRAFLESVTDMLWILDGQGSIQPYVGSYTDWKRTRDEEQNKAAAAEREKKKSAEKNASAEQTSAVKQKKKLTFKEQKEFDQLLPEIDQLEHEKAALEAQFSNPQALLARDTAAFTEARNRYDQIEHEIQEKTERWEYLATFCE